MMIKLKQFFVLATLIIIGYRCQPNQEQDAIHINRTPNIKPDYKETTIPPNVAPLNFIVEEPGDDYSVEFSNNMGYHFTIEVGNGKIQIPQKKWNKLTDSGKGGKIEVAISVGDENSYRKFDPFSFHIAEETIDPYLVYRLIHPGYYNWSQIKIVERSTEDFHERTIVDNQGLKKNCINCHSFNQGNPEQFLLHVRGSEGGTYIADDNNITRHNIKTEMMPGSATYPTWHPGGRFIAFSSNQVRQNFYAHTEKNIEVYDLISSLILYDRELNKIINITSPDIKNPLQTFPSWSTDGRFLYYCEAEFNDSTASVPDVTDVEDLQYNLKRIPFDVTSGTFGNPELMFDASAIGKSVSFPRMSPNGKFMIVTLTDFGTFPIWHNEADLYLIDTETGRHKYLEINSSYTESYHTWSSNGSWLVFSSKRIDKRSATPFFAYFRDWDTIGKPFVLPQKDPSVYDHMLETFNIPELTHHKIAIDTRDIVKAAALAPLEVKAHPTSEERPRWLLQKNEDNLSDIEKGVHE